MVCLLSPQIQIVLPLSFGTGTIDFAQCEYSTFSFCYSTFPLAERLFASHGDLCLLQVLWHPGSAEDNHIAFLTSDNTIR